MIAFVLATTNLIVLFVSLILNISLAFIVVQKADKVGSFRRFYYLFIIINIFYSLSQWLISPFLWSTEGIITVVASSIYSLNTQLMEIAFFLWFFLLIFTIILLSSSFIYRHVFVIRAHLLHIFDYIWFIIPWFLMSISVSAGIVVGAYLFTYPIQRSLRIKMQKILDLDQGINYQRFFIFGIDLDDNSESKAVIGIIGLVLVVIIIFSLLIIIFSTHRMKSFISINIHSIKTKQTQLDALYLLIFQTLNLVLFIYVPFLYRISTMFISFSNPEIMHWILSFSFVIYPIFNPLIIFAFTLYYREFIIESVKDLIFMFRFTS